MPEPFHIWLEGPITDPEKLDQATKQGDVCVDDVGTIRQRRYGNRLMPGGWTAQGNSPLSSAELTEKGTRPVWVIRVAMSMREPIEPNCYVVANGGHSASDCAPVRQRVEAVHDDGTVLLAGVGHVTVKTAGLVRVPPPE